MKTIFDLVFVSKFEYGYFDQLEPADQIHYFFDIYDLASNPKKSMDLAEFFGSIKDAIADNTIHQDSGHAESYKDSDRVDVMIDDQNILIESNSLRSIRHISLQFFEAGYLLARDKTMEKAFKKDKVTRYIRVYKIIDQVSTLCLN